MKMYAGKFLWKIVKKFAIIRKRLTMVQMMMEKFSPLENA